MIDSIGHLPMNPSLEGQAEVLRDIVYSKNGQMLDIILPWTSRKESEIRKPKPLVVFIQGSSWNSPNRAFEIPMLSHLAEKGITVASVGHRSAANGYPMPAFLVDVKCAIRFLRAHSDEYCLDVDRVVVYGTSSGGNAACLVGVTGDDDRFETEEYAGQSDSVNGVVSCFGPMDLKALFAYHAQRGDMTQAMRAYFGPDSEKWDEIMRMASPVSYVKKGKALPPFLLLNGTSDPVVPHDQMEAMYQKLKEAGADVTAYYVDGARHEGTFWSAPVRQVIEARLLEWLRPSL